MSERIQQGKKAAQRLIATVKRPEALPAELATDFDTSGEELEAWLAEEVSQAPERFDGPPLLVLDNRVGRKRWRRES